MVNRGQMGAKRIMPFLLGIVLGAVLMVIVFIGIEPRHAPATPTYSWVTCPGVKFKEIKLYSEFDNLTHVEATILFPPDQCKGFLPVQFCTYTNQYRRSCVPLTQEQLDAFNKLTVPRP